MRTSYAAYHYLPRWGWFVGLFALAAVGLLGCGFMLYAPLDTGNKGQIPANRILATILVNLASGHERTQADIKRPPKLGRPGGSGGSRDSYRPRVYYTQEDLAKVS
jgi:hypothetical protein